MKTPLILLALSPALLAEPLLTSWHTKDAGKYARIWKTFEDETSEKTTGDTTSVTTWDRTLYDANNAGFRIGDQTVNVYAGVQEISYSDDYVYIRSTGLPTHTAGPWYDDNSTRSNLFPSWPGNAKILFRFPRATSYGPTYTSTNQATNIGTCGLFVNGVPLFNTSDTFSYDTSSRIDQEPGNSAVGDGYWNRDAFTNEGPSFDSGNSHQAMEGHHYHANPSALRSLLGDSVDHNPNVVFDNSPGVKTNPYTENFNGSHSPIIGWVKDGLPIYGPYGYSDPTNADSTVRRMVTGYQKRDGSNGSIDLSATGRSSLPQWSVTLAGRSSTTGSSSYYGPDVSAAFPIGHYMEDYAYKGDLGLTLATDYDLNEYNVRYCVTPEFPGGTWAYFIAVATDGTPVYPYNLAYCYFGTPAVSSAVGSITETVTPFFTGGPDKEDINVSAAHESNGDVTITWDGIEGGIYRIETSTDLNTWDESDDTFTSDSSTITAVDSISIATNTPKRFYRLARTGIAPYEDATGATVSAGSMTHVFTFSGNLPPEANPISGVTIVDSSAVTTGSLSSYTASGTAATATVAFDATGLIVGQSYYAKLTATGPPPAMTALTFYSSNTYTHTAN